MSTASPTHRLNQYPNGVAIDGGEDREIRAVIYARTSSPNQKDNYSTDAQVELCGERCRLMGWKVCYIYREEGISAKDIDRPKFLRMMDRAMVGAFEVIVFWKLDRFCRSLRDLVNTEKKLSEWGVGLHSVTEWIDTTTPVGKFNFRNLASAAELEREVIGERARMGMHALALERKWPNKTPPFGYDKGEDDRLKINDKEARIVIWFFRRYLKTRSMPRVAYELNLKGIKTKRSGKWRTESVKNVLDNRIYLGEYSVAGFADYVEEYKIVGKDLFDRVHRLREVNKYKWRKISKPAWRRPESLTTWRARWF